MSHLLVTNGLLSADSCFAQGYLGTFGNESLYLPPDDCLSVVRLDPDVFNIVGIPEGTTNLYWINEIALEDDLLASLKPENPWEDTDNSLISSLASNSDRRDFGDGNVTVLYRTPTDSLLALRGDASEFTVVASELAPYHKGYAVPLTPTGLFTVAAEDISRVGDVVNSLSYDETVASFVESLSISQIVADLTWLTGEAPESPIQSRHSLHADARIAADWLVEQVESTGASCELRSFRVNYTPNVICRYTGTDNSGTFTLLSAHYDARGSSSSVNSLAPGGNDDGSGTTAILAIARAIASNSISFKVDVELVLFGGEEQGLLGSKAYAQELKSANADITLMVQADMIAYHKPGESAQLGLPQSIGTPEVTQLLANVSALYSPELTVGTTAACCSDHQPFYEQGFPASMVFERAGPIADPEYHSTNDISNRQGYDIEQLRSIAKVLFSALLHTAGFN